MCYLPFPGETGSLFTPGRALATEQKQLIPPRSGLVSHEFTGIIGAWVTQRQLHPHDFHLGLGKGSEICISGAFCTTHREAVSWSLHSQCLLLL